MTKQELWDESIKSYSHMSEHLSHQQSILVDKYIDCMLCYLDAQRQEIIEYYSETKL